jgi:hypothetical protein
MEHQLTNAKLAVYEKYKDIVQSKIRPITRRIEEEDAIILDPVESDAMMLRHLTIKIRNNLKSNIQKNIVENTEFSCTSDAAEVREVYRQRIRISDVIKLRINKISPETLKVLNQTEMMGLLEETVRESLGNSLKASAGNITANKVAKEMKKNGWDIIGRDFPYMSQDVDILAEDRNEKTIPEVVKIGVSSKRTNRERWRQNLVKNSNVDVFVHASLGTDLTLSSIENYPRHIHVVPNDADLTDELDNSRQVQRISWLTPDNIRRFIAEL